MTAPTVITFDLNGTPHRLVHDGEQVSLEVLSKDRLGVLRWVDSAEWGNYSMRAHELIKAVLGAVYRENAEAAEGQGVSHTPEDLLRKVVQSAGRSPRARWQYIEDIFGLTAMESVKLCKRFGFDPHKEMHSDAND